MATLAESVDALAALAVDSLDDEALAELVVDVSRQRDRLEAVLARAIAAQDRRASWQTDGARSQKQWLADRCGMSMGQAAAAAGRAKRLAELPETTAALADGRIGSGHARVATDAARDLPTAARAGLDGLVAEQAPATDPAALREQADDYTNRAAPDSLAERERRAFERRRLTTTRTPDGGLAVDARLPVEGGEAFLAALAPLAAPRGPDDRRAAEQRAADALSGLARRQLDAGGLPDAGGVRPHVTVTVSLEALQGAPGTSPAMLDRAGAVCAETARMLACDAGVCRVISVGASQPLDVGRQTRTVTPAQRRALAVRDGGCVGCRAPAGWCDAHHIKHWADGGPTDIDNLVLLCPACHRAVHHDGWRVRRRADGTFIMERRSKVRVPLTPTRGAPRTGDAQADSRQCKLPVQSAEERPRYYSSIGTPGRGRPEQRPRCHTLNGQPDRGPPRAAPALPTHPIRPQGRSRPPPAARPATRPDTVQRWGGHFSQLTKCWR